MKYGTSVIFVIVGLCSCRTVRTNADDSSCRDPFRITGAGTAHVPSLNVPAIAGRATLVGYVADSITGRGLRGGVILLRATMPESRDSAAAYSDSTGGFSIGGLRAGRYQYTVRSVNFSMKRGSIDLRQGIDTLRVSLVRGPPLCNVRMTEFRSP